MDRSTQRSDGHRRLDSRHGDMVCQSCTLSGLSESVDRGMVAGRRRRMAVSHLAPLQVYIVLHAAVDRDRIVVMLLMLLMLMVVVDLLVTVMIDAGDIETVVQV